LSIIIDIFDMSVKFIDKLNIIHRQNLSVIINEFEYVIVQLSSIEMIMIIIITILIEIIITFYYY